MKILGTEILYRAMQGAKTWLAMHARQVQKGDSEFDYFMVSRGGLTPDPEDKKPEAVMIIAITDNPGEERKLVVTSEFRIPIACREISVPAGLIDDEDYEGGVSIGAAAIKAATREMKEETGLDFMPLSVSPNNLYSSAGMTNESVMIVFGFAYGQPNTDGLEAIEDIETMLLTLSELTEMMDNSPTLAFSKVAWPFMWAFKYGGFLGFPPPTNGESHVSHHDGGQPIVNPGSSASHDGSD